MYKHLTQYELYYIWLHRVKEFDITLRLKVSQIANKLGKHRSTVYRALEFIRSNNWQPSDNNKITKGKYTRNKDSFKMITPKVASYIADKLLIV